MQKIQLLNSKDNLKPLSFNPFSAGTTYEIEGPSHKNNGVPMIVNGQQIEAEGKETIRRSFNGDVIIDGNLKIPSKELTDKLLFLIGQSSIEKGYNKKFKDRQRELAKEESKLIEKIEKGQTELNKKSVYNPFYQISKDTLDIKKKIATDRLKELAIEKEKLGALQDIFQKIGDDLYIEHKDLNKQENIKRVSNALDYIIGTNLTKKFEDGGKVPKEEFVLSTEAAENIDKIAANRNKEFEKAFQGPSIILPETANRSLQIEDLVNPYKKNPVPEYPTFYKEGSSTSNSTGFINGPGEFVLPDDLQNNEFAKEVYNELLTYSNVLSPQMMAGIMANIHQETGFNKKYLGKHGSKDHEGNTTSAQGLVGWIDLRWNALIPKIEAKGYDPNSIKGQVFGIVDELTTLFSNTYKKMAASISPEEAGKIFMYEYEEPGEKDDPTHSGYKRRVNGAANFFKPLDKGTTVNSSGVISFKGSKGEIYYVNKKRHYTQPDLDEITRHFGDVDEKIIKLKPGNNMKISQLKPHMQRVATYLARNYPGLVFSAFTTGDHLDGSAHYSGEAIDVGGTSSNKTAYENLRKDINKLVGMGLNIIDETHTTDKKPHLHISLSSNKYENGGRVKWGWLDDISEDGYLANSPDEWRAMNIIPTNHITMKGVKYPVVGVDNKGNRKLMHPGFNYIFDGDFVREFPIKAQSGKKIEEGEPIEGYPSWRQGYDNEGNIVHFNPETGENMTYLKGVTITANRNQRPELTREYFLDNVLPKFARAQGATPENLGEANEKEYQKYLNNSIAKEYLDKNPLPEKDEDRLKWLEDLENSGYIGAVENSVYSGILEPSRTQNFINAWKKIGAEFANSQVPLEYKLRDPLKNVEPVAGTTKEELRNVSRLEGINFLNAPGNEVRGLFREGVMKRLSQSGRPDNSSLLEQLIFDPMNIAEAAIPGALLVKLGDAGKLARVATRAFDKMEDFEDLTNGEVRELLRRASNVFKGESKTELDGLISGHRIDLTDAKLADDDVVADKNLLEDLFYGFDKVEGSDLKLSQSRLVDNAASEENKKSLLEKIKGLNLPKVNLKNFSLQGAIQVPIRPLTPLTKFIPAYKSPKGLFFPTKGYGDAKKLAGLEKLDIKDFKLDGYNRPQNRINWNPFRDKSRELYIPQDVVDKHKLVLEKGKLKSLLDDVPILNKDEFGIRKRDYFTLSKREIDKDRLAEGVNGLSWGRGLKIAAEGAVSIAVLDRAFKLIKNRKTKDRDKHE